MSDSLPVRRKALIFFAGALLCCWHREWENQAQGSNKTDDRVRRRRRPLELKERSLEGVVMKRITLIAGMASVATVAAVMWSVPAAAESMCGSSACAVVHNRWPGRPIADQNTRPNQSTPSGVPEPGMIPLLALGLGGVGFLALRRKRAQV